MTHMHPGQGHDSLEVAQRDYELDSMVTRDIRDHVLTGEPAEISDAHIIRIASRNLGAVALNVPGYRMGENDDADIRLGGLIGRANRQIAAHRSRSVKNDGSPRNYRA